MRIIQFFRKRRQDGFPVIKAVFSTGKAILLGTEKPEDDPAPGVIANYRKLIGYGIAALIAYAQNRWGWTISNEVAEVVKDVLVTAVLGLLVYSPRNNRPS